MTDVTTVQKLADDVGIPVEKLIGQLKEAMQDDPGLGQADGEEMTDFKPDQAISADQKQRLLEYLTKVHGSKDSSAPSKITLRRKKKTQVTASQGHKVNVVVRKKRTYKKRVVEAPEAEEEQVIEQSAEAPVEADAAVETTAPEVAAEPEVTEAPADEIVAEEKVEAPAADVAPVADEAKKAPAKKEKEKGKRDRDDDEVARPKKAAPKEEKRRGGKSATKVAIQRDLYEIEEEESGTVVEQTRSKTGHKRARQAKKHAFAKPTSPVVREIPIPETITVSDLAQRMAVKATEVIKSLMKMGTMATINQALEQDVAQLVVEEFGHKVRLVRSDALEHSLSEALAQRTGDKCKRAPVVTIMGHVDHGKTSLLDYIRSTRVIEGEAGGITQHIGAYSVATDKGQITFLDTPGHAAFTAMRARGANCTDIIVLVVAADDGVMPQTIEAIQHAKAAEAPLIVAINKMDKPEADPDKVTSELSQQDVISEDWGGDTQFVKLSAKSGDGVSDLLDAILLQAEVLELEAFAAGPATGVLVESRLDKGRGPVASLLVQQGQLQKGDMVLTGVEYGRVRAMQSDSGKAIDEAGPSVPVEILGLSGTATAGDSFVVVEDERRARELAALRNNKQRDDRLARQQKNKLENLFTNMGQGEVATLNVVLKSDVQGSAEALQDSLTKLANDEVKVNIVGSGVGGINESDIHLARASDALIIGFNVRADASARRVAEEEEAEIKYFSVIYDVIDTVKAALSGMLSPVVKEQIVGLAEVRDVFKSAKLGAVAGCMVIDGVVKRNNPIRVLRDNVVIYEGELESLRRFKEDVNEVRNGMECGIGVKNYNDVKAKDQIEVFERIEVARTL